LARGRISLKWKRKFCLGVPPSRIRAGGASEILGVAEGGNSATPYLIEKILKTGGG